MLVYLLRRHLEEERLNTAARAGAYARQPICPWRCPMAQNVVDVMWEMFEKAGVKRC
jgi:hypothetical protein